MKRKFALIGAPSSAGAYALGQERAPAVLRSLGLVGLLVARGHEVLDRGDVDGFRWRPDRERPFARNLEAVVEVAQNVAELVSAALQESRFPLVLGGDCTVGVGTLSGVVAAGRDRAGLLYFDLHADLNTPTSVPDGALDWMGLAHLLNIEDAEPLLTRIGSRVPLIQADSVLLYAFRADQASAAERQVIKHLGLEVVPHEKVVLDPIGTAAKALASLGSRREPLVVHFDVDVVDFTDAPLAENTLGNVGLSLDQALTALRAIASSEQVCALTVTELNPTHSEADPESLDRFLDGLVAAF